MKIPEANEIFGGVARGSLMAALCVAMVLPGGVSAQMPVAAHTAPLTQQEEVLHALNRLTFGPRPGDEAAVQRVGLEAWFQQQLHPENIDDAALETRLDAFPAMRLSEEELIRRFPPPAMIRQLAKNGGGTPSDPIEHAIYADATANYEANKKKQEQANANGGAADAAAGDMALKQDDPAAQNMASTDAMVKPTGDADTDNLMQDLAMASKDGDEAASAKAGKGKRAVGTMEPSEVQAVLRLSPEERFGQLIAMSPERMMQFRASLKPFQRVMLVQGLTPQQVEAVEAMQGPARVVGAEALESRLMRDIYSQRQLQAVMTDFWLNHFNVYVRKNQNEPYLLPGYLRDTILPNSLGKFEDLLVATAKSPAMLMYLDNWQSVGPDSQAATRVKRVQALRPNGKIAQALPKGINENYARELMELHTLGVGGGYTQQDVIEVAKCFTGWTIDRPYQVGTGATGGFVYEPNRHEPGVKTVLGHTIPEGGESEGLAVLHILATSPATAHFVSQKLAVRFVSDDPSPALVNAMAATFLKSNGDIKAVLTTMFHAKEFWSPQVYRAKVKTPIEFLTSAVRASDARVQNPLPLVQAMARLGMPVYGMQTPNGYAWTAEGWVSSNALISRMNFALVLSGNKLPGTQTDWPALLGNGVSVTDPTAGTEKQLEAMLLGQPAAEKTRATVMAQFTNTGAQDEALRSFTAEPKGAMSGESQMSRMEEPGMLRVGLGKKGGGGGAGFDAQPGTPLDTMAGLLLGSPEFQRR
ncbi:DUF1800 domain-containing protein [Granulicella paludicola]|uniref:DUF1800 domain-containing protein n=1 Tax=Granulicella paludicola TaxID=474951 RepID=UPI0021E010A6|nr:DUF1800 domain-containing protein [Granulicella paludicola]